MTRTIAVICLLCLLSGRSAGQSSLSFSYQGTLSHEGNPVNGIHEIRATLWNASVGGNQISHTDIHPFVQVTDGLFSIQINFDNEAFNDAERWLQLAVDGTTLTPRHAINASPYSITTRGIVVDDTNRVGLGTATPIAKLDVNTSTTNAGNNTARFAASNLGPNTSHIHYGPFGSWFIRSASSTGSVIMQDTGGIVGIGTSSPSPDSQVTVSAATRDHALLALSSDNSRATINTLNIGGGPSLRALGGRDVSASGGGFIVSGLDTTLNIGIDDNEIMARNNGAESPLYLNKDGGSIFMGPQLAQPAFAYGRVSESGSPTSFTSNITATHRHGVGLYDVHVQGGPQPGDVIIATVEDPGLYINARIDGSSYRIETRSASSQNPSDSAFSYLIFRP